ncbi:MAG: hypothetical protein WA908_11460 [Pontixanthobacter sp.]
MFASPISLSKIMFGIFIVGVLSIVALAGFADPSVIPRLMHDPAIIADIHPLTGAVSSLGAFLWMSTAAICAFSAVVLTADEPGRSRAFLISVAAISLFLCFDDFFMFHEWIAKYKLGLPETVIFAGLGAAVLTHILYFRAIIQSQSYGIFLCALAALGMSVAVDILPSPSGQIAAIWRGFAEDGFKWIGIGLWTYFHVAAAYGLVKRYGTRIGPVDGKTD